MSEKNYSPEVVGEGRHLVYCLPGRHIDAWEWTVCMCVCVCVCVCVCLCVCVCACACVSDFFVIGTLILTVSGPLSKEGIGRSAKE